MSSAAWINGKISIVVIFCGLKFNWHSAVAKVQVQKNTIKVNIISKRHIDKRIRLVDLIWCWASIFTPFCFLFVTWRRSDGLHPPWRLRIRTRKKYFVIIFRVLHCSFIKCCSKNKWRFQAFKRISSCLFPFKRFISLVPQSWMIRAVTKWNSYKVYVWKG